MALIVEVLSGRQGAVRQRLRVEGASLSIGRALTNALILDDPHVDGVHARVVRGDDGSYHLEDNGSVNRIESTDGLLHDRIAVREGTELQLGRTWLRFRDEMAPVAPAQRLPRVPVTPARPPRWFERPRGRAGIIVTALVVSIVEGWIATPEQNAGATIFGMVLTIGFLLLVWAGIWAVAARAVTGRFAFLAHLAIVAAALIAYDLGDQVKQLTEFLFPENGVVPVLFSVLMLAVLAAVVAGHLRYASHLNRVSRWRAGAAVSSLLLALYAVFALVDDDQFTSNASFSSEIRTLAPALVPTQSVEEFSTEMAELRREVDALLEQR